MNRSGTKAINRILGIMTSRRWVVSALAALGGASAVRRVSATPLPLRQQEETYNGRRITFAEETGTFVVSIDGTPVDTAIRVEQIIELGPDATPVAGATPEAAVREAFSSDFFPFRTFETPEEIGRALVDTEGQLWILDR